MWHLISKQGDIINKNDFISNIDNFTTKTAKCLQLCWNGILQVSMKNNDVFYFAHPVSMQVTHVRMCY